MRRPRDEDGALLKMPLYRLQYGRNFKILSDKCCLNSYPEKLLDEESLLTLPILEIGFCLFLLSAYLFQNAMMLPLILPVIDANAAENVFQVRIGKAEAEEEECF